MNLALSASLATSHVSPWESLSTVRDSSLSRPGYGNWAGEAEYGKWNWVEFDFGSNKRIWSIDVWWWEEGDLLRPDNAYISYYDGSNWVISSSLTNLVNGWNTVTGGYIAQKIRVNMMSAKATGIIECQIFGASSDVENLAFSATLTTSHVSPWESLPTLRDGSLSRPGYGNWAGTADYGKWNWVEFDFGSNKRIWSIDVWWWEEGDLLRPDNAYISYYNGSNWVISFSLTNLVNGWNTVTGGYIAQKIRVNMRSAKATGIIECQIFGDRPTGSFFI